MKAKDIFGVILRTVALYLIIWGAWQLLAVIAYIPRTIALIASNDESSRNSIVYFVYGFPAFLSGILAFLFADTLVGFTYRRSSE